VKERSRVGPIDGLRGVALVAVLLYHAAPGTVRGGFLGVEAFFVLSGYLLTALLLDEHRRTGTIDRWAYGERRVRRIYPAMIVLLSALIVFVPLLDYANSHRLPLDVLSSLVGMTNWRLIADGTSYFAHLGNPSYVRHLWSIAIELQFYVLCPFLVAWLARRRVRVAAGALVAGILFEVVTLIFPIYLSINKGLNAYGKTFGLFFLLMTFFYLVGLITVVGVEVNSVLHPVNADQSAPEAPPPNLAPESARPLRPGIRGRTVLILAVVASGIGVLLGRRTSGKV